MSRISKYPVELPEKVDVNLTDSVITVKGPLGELQQKINSDIKIDRNDNLLQVQAVGDSKQAKAMSGTMRSLLANMVHGVAKGFEKKLTLVGVGYRAQMDGKNLNLNLGYSHSILHRIPQDIKIETPSPTEILIKGIDKQKVGQVAAEVRAYRKPEHYKGKGVRYSDEIVILKEAKKK
jgi:large subunit ribosomal protein L6